MEGNFNINNIGNDEKISGKLLKLVFSDLSEAYNKWKKRNDMPLPNSDMPPPGMHFPPINQKRGNTVGKDKEPGTDK